MTLTEINQLASAEVNHSNYRDMVSLISYLNHQYYIENQQLVSDREFDELYDKVKAFEAQNPSLVLPESPTQSVAKGIKQSGTIVKHLSPMLSLSNSYNEADLINFDESIAKELPNIERSYFVEPKYDGSSISLVYHNGQLIRAATRGNGIEGEDITANSLMVKNILPKADFEKLNIKRIELRGEVVIDKAAFDQMNIEREELGLPTFQNPRNTASGSLRLKDPSEVKNRNLEALIYSVGMVEYIDPNGPKPMSHSQSQNIEILSQLGFETAAHAGKRCKNIAEAIQFCAEYEIKRPTLRYEIDGMVIKLDNIDHQQLIGMTSHHPKWAIAFKFKAIEKATTLLDIEYQVGRTGIVSPVAKVAPVDIGGVTVRSVSLHNEDNILTKDIRIGDTVMVSRAGDVIPQISRVDYKYRRDQVAFKYIENCPVCHSRLIRRDEEAAWRCVSTTCPAQKLEKIIYFVSKDAMNIKGLGRDIIKRFVAEGIIRDIVDIYRLDYDQILALDGWKEQSVNKLRESIEESKQNELWRLIVALGIDNVGVTMSKVLAKKVAHLLDYCEWTTEEFLAIDDVGPKMAQSLYSFFSNTENKSTLTTLQSLGVNLKGTAANTNGTMYGQIVVFTGFRDAALSEAIERAGGEVVSSLSKKTTILVMKEKGSGSSKEKKALEYGTLVYSIEEMRERLNQI